MSNDEIIRVFVGSDRTQDLAVDVLRYSINRHTTARVDVRSMSDIILANPRDVRQGARTMFSFTRFKIPELCGYKGRAIYVDADMQVFKDIRGLWNIPFDGKKVQILEEVPEEFQPKEGQVGAPTRRKKQSSVMLLDCANLNWVAEDIIAGLDGDYTYDELLSEMCILEEDEIGYGVPWIWNSLESHVPGKTALTHYTDMFTQPWVSLENPIGWVWVDEVRGMLANEALSLADIEREVGLGYFRPSLIDELKSDEDLSVASPERQKRLQAIDDAAGFVKHKEVYDRKRARSKALKEYEKTLAAQPLSKIA